MQGTDKKERREAVAEEIKTDWDDKDRQDDRQDRQNKQERQDKQDGRNSNPLARMMLVEVVSLLAGIIILVFVMNGRCSVSWWIFEKYINIAILVLIPVLTLPTMISSGLWKDFIRAFSLYKPGMNWKLRELKRSQDAIDVLQKQLLYAAVMIVVFQFINILYNMTDLSVLGPSLSNIFLTAFYTAVLELLLMPLKIEVKKQITDFMEEA